MGNGQLQRLYCTLSIGWLYKKHVDTLRYDQSYGLSYRKATGAVDDLRLRELTIVLFMSDNGSARNVPGSRVTDEEWEEHMTPLQLRGKKSTVYENGIRSPLFLRWGDRLKAVVNSQLLMVMDILLHPWERWVELKRQEDWEERVLLIY
ncbi:MAG: sulfatase-like hydrolase/transferase [Verrucomicrobiota bacterium]